MDLQINKYTKKQKRDQPLYGGSSDSAVFLRNCQLLEEKLNYAQKQLSAGDFLKITQVIGNDDEYQVKINLLLPNTSAVVTKKLSNANPGDIFFKNTDYSIQHITAERGGIYYPALIEQILNSTTYRITYQFLANEPSTPEVTVNTGETADPAQKMIFNLQNSGVATSYYERISAIVEGVHQNSVTSTIDMISGVSPVIKGFTSSNEEVYGNLVYTTVNNKFVIGNNSNPIPLLVNYIIIK